MADERAGSFPVSHRLINLARRASHRRGHDRYGCETGMLPGVRIATRLYDDVVSTYLFGRPGDTAHPGGSVDD